MACDYNEEVRTKKEVQHVQSHAKNDEEAIIFFNSIFLNCLSDLNGAVES